MATRVIASGAQRKRHNGEPKVATDLLVNDKTLAIPSPPQATVTCKLNVWTSYADGGLEVRNGRTGEVINKFEGGGATASGARGRVADNIVSRMTRGGSALSAENCVVRSMVTVTTRDGQAQVWLGLSSGVIEVHNGEEAGKLLLTLCKHVASVNCLTEFGGLVYSGGDDRQIIQWRVEGARHIRVFTGTHMHDGTIRCLYSEGNCLVSGAEDCAVKVWDVGTGTMRLTGYFHSQSGGVFSLCRVGETMWSGDNIGQIVRWTLRTCEAIQISRPHEARVTVLRKVGSRVYSGSADGMVGVHCAQSGSLIQRVEDQAHGWVTTIACPAQLSRFVVWSAGSDGLVRCWHQDEFTPITGDHDCLNDATWYLSGSTPYRELRASFAHRNADLRDQLAVSESRDQQAMSVLRRCSAAFGGRGGAGGTTLDQFSSKLRDQMRLAEERDAAANESLQARKGELARLERELATAMALMQAARNELNVLAPGAVQRLEATLSPLPEEVPGAAALSLSSLGAIPGVPVAAGGATTTSVPTGIAGAAGGGYAPGASTVPVSVQPMPFLGTVAGAVPGILPGGVPGGAVPLPGAASVTGAVPGAAPGAPSMAGVPPVASPLPGTTAILPTASSLPTATAAGAAAPLPAPATSSTLGVGGPLTTPGIAAAQTPALPVPGATGTGVAAAAAVGSATALLDANSVVAGAAAVGGSGAGASRAAGAGASPSTVADAIAGAAGAKEGAWNGVAWTNPNVGNYIQRRYYGALPSLRAPEIEKRDKRKHRTPVVKVVPLSKKVAPKPPSTDGVKSNPAAQEPQPTPTV